MSASVDEADLALPLLLGRVHQELARRYSAAARSAGCTVEEWWVLSCLAARDGRPMHEIAEYAGMPNPSLTKVVDRMVAGNLVFRRVDPEDRRRTLLYLTARGRENHGAVADAVARLEADLAASVGEQTYGTLRAALAEISPTLRA